MDRRTEAAGSGSGGASPTAVTSRGTVDEELDDLTLDAELDGADSGDEDGNGKPTGVMAPPAKRSATRKPPTRKPAGAQPGSSSGNSNGRAASNGNGSPKKEPAPADADSDLDEKTTEMPSAAAVAVAAPADSVKEPVTARESAGDSALRPAPGESEASADQMEPSADQAGSPVGQAGKADGSDTEQTVSMAAPAMPADDIWSPRASRQPSGSAPSWTPVEASERPRGNAFEVNDAFSAPPMPSDTTFTPPPATYPASSADSSSDGSSSDGSSSPGSSATSFQSSAFGSFASPAAGETAKAKRERERERESTPPARAFPRPVGAASRGAGPAAKLAKAAKPKATVRRSTSRQAHLTISRVEPWSVMKFSFAVSVVAFIVLFVAVAILFAVLSALGVFDSLQHLVNSVTSSQGSSGYNVKKWFTASRILSYTAMLGGINIILITAISTIGSVIYNLASRLIGGVEVTLKETD